MIGQLVGGRYLVTQVLGEGGMGVVYLGQQQLGESVRKVAIKTLQRELSTDPSLVARFQRECSTVVSLEHPNTIRLYDFGATEDGTLYMAMEFVAGRPLSQLIEEGPLPAPRVMNILRQLCGALAEAHGRGIVHRDLKPENVLLSQHGGEPDFVKLLDFGIARTLDVEGTTREKLTQPGTVLGTPQYMSPEQFSGKEVDVRSDVYSLGVMTYEMLTAHLPFSAESPVEWAMQHLTTEPAPLEDSTSAGRIPIALRSVTMQALSKNREQRPASAHDFFERLSPTAPIDATSPASLPVSPRTVVMESVPATASAPRLAARRWLLVALVPACAIAAIASFRLLAPTIRPNPERVRERRPEVVAGPAVTSPAATALTSSVTARAQPAPILETTATRAPAAPSPSQSAAPQPSAAGACEACVVAAKAGNVAGVVLNLALCKESAGKARCLEASKQHAREQGPLSRLPTAPPKPSASTP